MVKVVSKIVYLSLMLIAVIVLVVLLTSLNTKTLNFDINNDNAFNDKDMKYWMSAHEQKLVSSEFLAQLISQVPEDGKVKCRFGNNCLKFTLASSDVAPIVGFVVANGLNGELNVLDNVVNKERKNANKITGNAVTVVNPTPSQTGYLPDGSNYEESYLLDGSRVINKPDGTKIIYNSDGSGEVIQIYQPDGTKEFYGLDMKGNSYISSRENIDGSREVYEKDKEGNVYLRTRFEEDGTKAYYSEKGDLERAILSDNSKIYYGSRGEITDVEYPDGTQAKYNSDGSVDVKNPDGTTYKTYPQGLSSEDSAAYIPNKDGDGGTGMTWNYDKNTGEATNTKVTTNANGEVTKMEVYTGNPDTVGGNYYTLTNPVKNSDGSTTYDYETGGYVDANGNRGNGQYKTDYTGQITLPAGNPNGQESPSLVNVDGNKLTVN